MWINEGVIYQIYPLGFCGAPRENDEVTVSRILKIKDWIEYFNRLGLNAILFNPVFESDRHGYDTRDFQNIDCRLGTNEDFASVCKSLHENNIRIILDGVFNHVGRGFFAFRDVLENRENSKYKDWFLIRFGENNSFNDGLFYEGWEGHYELVKLNLHNPEVVDYIFSSVRKWIEDFDIDALRLDVAYCLDREFIRKLRSFCTGIKKEFVLIGEVLFGDYNQIVNSELLHSCTNYECYKGMYSSLNDLNLFEISYSLNRQFGPDQYTLYKGKHLLNFTDNHDVTRVATILKDKNHLPLIYGLMFCMPGIPCLYYGSEWGAEGDKKNGDDVLRPCFEKPCHNELTLWITKLIEIFQNEKALQYGDYHNVVIQNRQLVFSRSFERETIYVGINVENSSIDLNVPICGDVIELLDHKTEHIDGILKLEPYGISIMKQINR